MGLLVFYIVPFIGSVQYAFYNSGFFPEWVGLDNFKALLNSRLFGIAMKNTGIFIFFNVPVVVIISFFCASLAWRATKLGSFFRNSLVITYMVPTAALVSIWLLFFDASGPLNSMLAKFGIERIKWLTSSSLRWPVIIMYLWKNVGFNMIIILAGFHSIDKTILEASTVDGAGWLTRQIKIVAPMMIPTLFFVTVISIINSLKIFKEAYLIGGEYPDLSIYTMQHFINNEFYQMNYSVMVAASLILVFAICVIVFALYKFEKSKSETL